MVANDIYKTPADVWEKLAAPVPVDLIQWRRDGKIISRDGKFWSRYVPYIEANFVRLRFDDVVPGEWDLTLTQLPILAGAGEERDIAAFKARVQVLGVVREDVGQGEDYKSAATDAFKRAAVRFGIGHELYSMTNLWVEMDGDGKFSKPLRDPAAIWAEKTGRKAPAPEKKAAPAPAQAEAFPEPKADPNWKPLADADPDCPECGGKMWDNRLTKRNPKAPDFKCKDRSCEGVIWPGEIEAHPEKYGVGGLPSERRERAPRREENFDDLPSALEDRDDDLPF